MAERNPPRPVKLPTLYDVAESAGVSHQTVSRVVKGETNIRADLRERIESAIRELDYRPNLTARALASASKHRIAAIVYEFLEVGPNRMAKGASDGAKEAGYLLDIVSLDPRDEQGIEESLSITGQHDLAGLLVIAPSDQVMELIGRVGFTLPVYIESEASPESSDSAVSPNHRAVVGVVDYLLSLGHRRFFNVAGPDGWVSARKRVTAYAEGLEAGGGISLGTIPGNWTSESGYAAGMQIPLDQGVSAVVVGNDQMALGVLAALADRGVRVPEEMSVVGFDDIPEAQYFRPSLTTIRRDFERQGRVALERLLAEITGDASGVSELIEPELIVRGSTGPAPR
ncbi:MAG TPA: LacI family DNA-binding transcriptional regulator [Galbitalea sp.]|jgi:LacI family transcriptional regulator